jgi:hypothetical protein
MNTARKAVALAFLFAYFAVPLWVLAWAFSRAFYLPEPPQ